MDLTFGALGAFPTLGSVAKTVLICMAVGAGLGFINWKTIPKNQKSKEDENENIWISDDEMTITYETLPPNFRNIQEDDCIAQLSTCGFCKYYDRETGCMKYGVKGYGVGNLAKTLCDDFDSTLKE